MNARTTPAARGMVTVCRMCERWRDDVALHGTPICLGCLRRVDAIPALKRRLLLPANFER